MNELYICYIVENEENIFFRCSLESALAVADKVIIINGGTDKGTPKLIDEVGRYTNQLHKIKVINSPYDHASPGGNGKQRNKYLAEVPNGAWVLRLDADEVLSDNAHKLRSYMSRKTTSFDVKMIHFVYNLGLEDASMPEHFVPKAFFKKAYGIKYPEVEHPVIEYRSINGSINDVIIYHFGYAKGIEPIMKKFHNHMEKSNIHTKDFLLAWKNGHIFGGFPVKPFNKFHELPFTIRREFGI